MEEETKDIQDKEVIITDLEPSEHALNLSNAWRKAHLFFRRHRRMWKRILFLGFFVILVVGVLSIPPLRNSWWSKISGIPLDAVTIRIQHRDLYAQRQIDGSLAWHATLDSSPEGPPHITDHVVYVLSQNHTLYAFNEQDGSLLWRYHSGDVVSYPPVTANHVIYVGASNGAVKAIRATNGSILWRLSRLGVLTSPLVVENNLLYLSINRNTILALHTMDGSVLWRASSLGTVTSPLTVKNAVVYYSVNHNMIVALNAQSGSLLWKRQLSGIAPNTRAFDEVYRTGELLLYLNHSRSINSKENSIVALRASDGSFVWSSQIDGWPVRLAIVSDRIVYILSLNGTVAAYESSNGRHLWQIQLGNAYTSSMAIAHEKLYIYAVDGAFDILQTSTGSLLRHSRTNFPVLFPIVVNDRGYVSMNAVDSVQIKSGQAYSEIISFNADDGSTIWRYPTFPPLSSPLFSEGNIYVNDIQGRVYALHAADGILLWHSE
jgi:outer membrane protein assembly factor BamB